MDRPSQKILLLLIVMAVALNHCEAQINDFRDIFAICIPNKMIIMKRDSIESERTYLGCIEDDHKNVVYYVVKEFYTVQTAIVRHGHSRVLFFDKEKKLAGLYNLDDWEWLPYALSRNSLYFKCKENNVEKIHVVRIGKKLPVPLCVMPNESFWPQKE